MTNSICNKSASHWTCVLCCVVGLLLTGIAAANTRLLRFGYGEQEREDLCLQSDMFFDESRSPMPLTIQGHLYYRKGGCVPETVPLARKGQPLPLPLQGQKILVTYKIQTKPGGTQHGHADDSEHTQKTRTDQLGSFQVTTTPVPTDALSVKVTVKYYGQESEQRAPVAEETRVLRPKKFSANPQLTSADDQPTDTQGPKGQYQVRAWLPDDKGTQSFDDRMKKLHLEATHEAQWFNDETLQKLLKAVEINLLKTEQENNAAVYTVQGTDNRAGVVAIKAVYQASDDNQTASEPFMLAFGCKAELGWKNNAPQATDGFACPHADQDEVILQRPSVSGGKAGYSRRYFQKEHALVTLKLKSLLDNQSPLEKIPVKWQLADKQPPNMAVFLGKNTDDEGDAWRAEDQKVDDSLTDKDGHSECPVSARQLYKMDDKDQENWRPYTPAVGKAVVVADIQGQHKQIEVPFIDSLWQLAEASKDNESITQINVLGYVGTDRESQASRKLVTEQMTDSGSTEGRQLLLSARHDKSATSDFSFLLPQQSLERALQFPCKGLCRETFEKYFGRMCIEQVRPSGARFDFDTLSEEAQESRKNITIKFVPDESSQQCENCSPPFPDQPATTEGPVEDGAFCFDKPLNVPSPTLQVLGSPDTECSSCTYSVEVSLPQNKRSTFGPRSELDKIRIEVAEDAPLPTPTPPKKGADQVEISKATEYSSNNSATYTVTGKDNEAGVIAIKAVYEPTESITTESEPLLLAFGYHAKLTWENLAPDYNYDTDKTDSHEADDEVILQRHADRVISDTSLFMDEHAQVTLKLTSWLDDSKASAGISVKWKLPDNQPPNMAVFLSKTTDDNGSSWAANEQKRSGQTDEKGENKIEVSARQLYKVTRNQPTKRAVTGGRQDNQWRSFVPATGDAIVVADIQGQQEQIKVPFVDSLWVGMVSHDFGLVSTIPDYVEGYFNDHGYVRPGKIYIAHRRFVSAFLDRSSELKKLHFSVEAPEQGSQYDIQLAPSRSSGPFSTFFPCSESKSCNDMCAALKDYTGKVCFKYQASPTAASVRIANDTKCPQVCKPLTPPQPHSDDGDIEDGFCCVPEWNHEKDSL